MKSFIIAAAIIVLFMLGGCSSNKGAENTAAGNQFDNSQNISAMNINEPKKHYNEELTLYVEQSDYVTAKYEPSDGCYIGADITNDKTVFSNISRFEDVIPQEHDLYSNEMKLGGSYPFEWVLECIGASKTPVIKIIPQNPNIPFQDDMLIKTAKDAGELSVPMFIQFYPYSIENGYNKSEYVNFFRKAKKAFEQNAPKAALIWSVYADSVYDCFSYYPGDDYADWVGINIEQKISENGADIFKRIFKNIDFFYYSFQKQKPIMITQLSVSHYSTDNMKYYTREAAAEIYNIYKTVGEKYPKIKGVIYNSYNEIDFKQDNEKKTYNNFLIMGEKLIEDAYTDAISLDRFAGTAESEKLGADDSETIRSPFPAYKNDGGYFISEKSLKYDVQIVGLNLLSGMEVNINGDKYYNLDVLEKHLKIECEIADETASLVLKPMF